MRLKIIILFSIFLLSVQSVFAMGSVLNAVPKASVVGRGVLTYVFLDVYQVSLYAPQGRFDPQKPFALSLQYFLSIKGEDIADRSIKEMRKQGFKDKEKLATWNDQMKSIFPDVKKGTVLTGVYIPGEKTIFYNGDKIIGVIKDDVFGKQFFGIWLNEKTSEPELRRTLLGLS